MIDERLRLILENVFGGADNDDYLEAISQIKALVVESLGDYKNPDDVGGKTYQDKCCRVFGYNQKIAELKKKWK